VGYAPFPITVHEARKIPFLVRQPWTQKLHQIERLRGTLGPLNAREIGEGGQRGGEVEPEAQGNEAKPDKEREEDKFTSMAGGDGDNEEVEKVTFQSSGSIHQLVSCPGIKKQ
jgi:hypothetical protein